MGRALSVYQVLSAKWPKMDFTGEWLKAFGAPERYGNWIVWGQSFNGKTSFAMQLAKYLTRFGKVLYNSMEEGCSTSIQKALLRANMREVSKRFFLLENEEIEALTKRLTLKKHPSIVFMDSLQYSGIDYIKYKWLKQHFPKILWIWISHAEGKLPDGRLANKIRYDASVKIRVEGYRAYINSRFNSEFQGDNNILPVWDYGAERYWGEKQQQKETKNISDNEKERQ